VPSIGDAGHRHSTQKISPDQIIPERFGVAILAALVVSVNISFAASRLRVRRLAASMPCESRNLCRENPLAPHYGADKEFIVSDHPSMGLGFRRMVVAISSFFER
jgi:hypothetical protein